MAQTTVKTLADLLSLSTMTLATVNPRNEPHATPVYFAAQWQGNLRAAPDLFFFSDPNSRHCQDLATNSQAAATIYPLGSTWREIHGLQIHGTVRPVFPGQEWEIAWENFRVKFPFVAGLKDVIARNTLYRLRPQWIRLVDNRRGFGHKEEWEYHEER